MISILMPIYNGFEFIDDSVLSVLRQKYENWELIIGVNGHPENSDVYQQCKKIDHTYEKIRAYDLHYIKGKANALNEMLQYCKYNYVAILDVDDIWTVDKLEKQTPFLHIYDVVGSLCVFFGDYNGITPDVPLGDFSDSDFTKGNPIINSSVVVKKELCHWIENGIEDYDLWLRLRKKNKKFFNVNGVLVMHRIHKNSAFNSKGHADKIDDIVSNNI
jgi:glycosyltransferase involved in cell wall biosynthesis